jgi:hypothetical protein
MSQVLHPAQDLEPSDYDCVALIRKASALHLALDQIVSESVALRERCVLLAQEAREVQQLGDGTRWKIEKRAQREFSLQMLTAEPRNLRLNTQFSLVFRVIDRNGASLKLRSNDVFEVKVVAAKANNPRKWGPCRQTSLSIIGSARMFPAVTNEVEFAGISLAASKIPAMGVKVWLCVTCVNRQEIKPFQLPSFGVRRSAS